MTRSDESADVSGRYTTDHGDPFERGGRLTRVVVGHDRSARERRPLPGIVVEMRRWETEQGDEPEWVLEIGADGSFTFEGPQGGSAPTPRVAGRWIRAGEDLLLLPEPSAAGARAPEIRLRVRGGNVYVPWEETALGLLELELTRVEDRDHPTDHGRPGSGRPRPSRR